MLIRSFHILNVVLSIIMLLGISTITYAESENFHSPYFDLPLGQDLKLVLKTEKENEGFYQYVFSSSSSDDAAMQMRVIISSKAPENGQSLEDFQTNAIANMSVMFIDAFGLYKYLDTPENKKALGEKPNKFHISDATFSEITMKLGSVDVSFLVTNLYNMTYAFTLISRDDNEQTRQNNLNQLAEQLKSIRFNSV
jgi:hypothetical protein